MPVPAEGTSWRDIAVARSLDSARTRAENRVQRFLDAAVELVGDGSSGDFTVQEVVDRSGQSLRSFYQYFGGKHELLLALFEESVRKTVDVLRQSVSEEQGARDRLHRFVTDYYRFCRPVGKGRGTRKAPAPVMAEFAQQLLTAYPREAARAFQPLLTLFLELLGEASTVGVVRPGLDPGTAAGMVLQAVMFNAFSSTIGGVSSTVDEEGAAEALWDLVLHGIGTSDSE